MGSGPNGGENFKMPLMQIMSKSSHTCPEFPPNGPHKITLEIFEILSFWF